MATAVTNPARYLIVCLLITACSRYIWPLEAKLVCHDYVYDGTRLALAEMLLGGTTCINDM
jgi:5-methylthioadenosine/S-adenosylhomocysteine deaminase